MSQFTLTAEEDAIVLDALRSKANEYHNLYGATDPTLEALVAKVEAQTPAPIVEPTEAEIEAHFTEEAPTRKKKAK
jgi:hypothetical protein